MLETRHKVYPQLIEVDPHRIKFNEQNPQDHRGTEFQRLKASVKEIGVVQEPTVRVLAGGFYECIDGEGRVRAAQEAGLATIWVVSLGIVNDADALVMLQAANTVREFSYLAYCKGLANLHRQGQTTEHIARSIGGSRGVIGMDIAVGYFPEQTLALIQDSLLQSNAMDTGLKQTLVWSSYTLCALLPLRIQVNDAPTINERYDYTEVHHAVEKIVQGEILTHERLESYVEQRRRELFEERFDKALQTRLDAEVERAKQVLEEAHVQDLRHVQEETAHQYEVQIDQLQGQLSDLGKRYEKIMKEGTKRPELFAEHERELARKCQKTEEERSHLQNLQRKVQEEAQDHLRKLEQELRDQAEAKLGRDAKQVRADLEAYYAQRDEQRQIRVEKTFRQAIAHGTELLSQTEQWLLLLTTTEMLKGLPWLSKPEMGGLLMQIKTVRETLERAEEVMLHGDVPDAVSAEEGGSPDGYDQSQDERPTDMGQG